MTEPVAIKAMLAQMGFTPEDQDCTYEMTHQGIQSIKCFGQLNEESVKTLCKVPCIPGLIVTVDGAHVVDNGFNISVMAETNLQGVVNFVRHYDRIARVIVPPNITPVKVQNMYHQRDMESKHDDPTVVPDVDAKDWPQTLEATIDYIRGFR